MHKDPLGQLVSEALGVDFSPKENTDLCPTQSVSLLRDDNSHLVPVEGRWGIRPVWAKREIINAQVETVASKPTFKASYADKRCVVPCSGWYEWSSGDGAKAKYLFRSEDQSPLYMAGIWFEGAQPNLVTLTTKPDAQCAAYHHRMPLLIPKEAVLDYVCGAPEQVTPMLSGLYSNQANDFGLVIEKCA